MAHLLAAAADHREGRAGGVFEQVDDDPPSQRADAGLRVADRAAERQVEIDDAVLVLQQRHPQRHRQPGRIGTVALQAKGQLAMACPLLTVGKSSQRTRWRPEWLEDCRRAEALLARDRHGAAPLLWRSGFRHILAGALRRKVFTFEKACDLQAEAEQLMAGAEHEVALLQLLERVRDSEGCAVSAVCRCWRRTRLRRAAVGGHAGAVGDALRQGGLSGQCNDPDREPEHADLSARASQASAVAPAAPFC
jgi:hypothetical protein